MINQTSFQWNADEKNTAATFSLRKQLRFALLKEPISLLVDKVFIALC
jgi:hypothetical protein